VYVVLDLYPDLAATLGRIKEGGLVCRRWHGRDTRAMRDAAAVVSIAERMTERIRETRGIPRSKLRTIHDGFDPARVVPAEGGGFESRYNPEGRFVVQYAGNMGLSHPFDTILAAARVLADDSRMVFQFIGDGPQRRHIQANLPPNAQLIDYQPADRLGQVLGAADVGLISQHQEMFDKGLPYKIYATLAAGKASIFVGNGKSEIADWLEKSGAGRQVDQGEDEKLAGLLRDLASDRSLTDQMGQAARSLFDERFDSQRAAERWVELIEEVITAGG
jgi:glycosyltransferase involved in cell wall biosynthesis